MSDLVTSSFREDDPAGLARSLRVMAASIPVNGTVTVTLTPVAARIAARSIEAGLQAEAARGGRPDTGSRSDDMILRDRTRQQWSIALLAAALAIGLAVLLVLP
jgi:hypothetical protein